MGIHLDSIRIQALARALFGIALLFAAFMAFLPHPPQLPTDTYGDKFEHMLAFAVLAALAGVGWPLASRWRVIERLSFLGALIELVQSIPALNRDCDIGDWVADTLAIMVVTAIIALLSRRSGRGAAQ